MRWDRLKQNGIRLDGMPLDGLNLNNKIIDPSIKKDYIT